MVYANENNFLQVINGGLRLLSNETGKNRKLTFECPWRISVEGLPFLLPYLTKRVLPLGLMDIVLLLVSKEPVMYSSFVEEKLRATLKDTGLFLFVEFLTIFRSRKLYNHNKCT